MFEKFSGRDTEIGVFLETLEKEVTNGGGSSVGEGRVLVVYDAE
jgi:hypothetical protein